MSTRRFEPRLVDSLYLEAMVLADEARSYFDEGGRADRDTLPPLARVGYACESLKLTTRLMHVIAWLLMRRAVEAGELSAVHAGSPARRLGAATLSDPDMLPLLPEAARALIASSRDLYDRVARLEAEMERGEEAQSPARGLIQRLERAF